MYKKLYIYIFFLYLCNNYLCCFSSDDLVVQVLQGTLKGVLDTATEGRPFRAFLGVPFAAPPLGDLRFKEPKEIDSWQGVRESNQIPPICLQMSMLELMHGANGSLSGQEDCLYLNVFTPAKTDNSFPVMVYIHGGAYVSGGAIEYPPHYLMNEDILLIVIQYRLGALGFLSTGDKVLPGNLGMKDQTMALQWVQKNIKSFGGDPSRVTIFGESAGGGSVHQHMLTPHSKGLFHRLIAQSGCAFSPWAFYSKPRNAAKTLGQKVGCPLEENSQQFLDCIMKLSADEIIKSAFAMHEWGVSPMFFTPVLDGQYFPDDLEKIAEKRHNIDMMIGYTRDEAALFVYMMNFNENLKKPFISEDPRTLAISMIIEEEDDYKDKMEKIFKFYLNGKPRNPIPEEEIVKLNTDRYFKVPSQVAAASHIRNEVTHNTYMYSLDHRGQLDFADIYKDDPQKKYISHVDDLLYLFGVGGPIFFRPIQDATDKHVQNIILKTWTNFAKTGDPTPDFSLGFIWEPMSLSSFRHISLNETPRMIEDNTQKVREFWLSLELREYKGYIRGGRNFLDPISLKTNIKDEL